MLRFQQVLVLAGVGALVVACSGNGSANEQAPVISPVAEVGPAWLRPMAEAPKTYPANLRGSPYPELLNTVVLDWGKKGEFDSTAGYQAKLAKIPERVSSRFGKVFVFRSIIPETVYDADSKTFSVLHTGEFKTANNITIGREEYAGGNVMYGINVQGCPKNPSVRLAASQARPLKSGIEDRSIGIFYVGHIDFSKKGWVAEDTLLNHETIPGFHTTAISSSDGNTGAWDLDFNVQHIDFVEMASGKVVSFINCRVS